MRTPTPVELRAYREHQLVPLAVLPNAIARSVRDSFRLGGSNTSTIAHDTLISWGRDQGAFIFREVLRALLHLDNTDMSAAGGFTALRDDDPQERAGDG